MDDDEDFLAAVVPEIEKIAKATVTVAKSRDGASAAIRSAGFDLYILDLNLPTVDAGLDLAVTHGLAVFHEVRAAAPRTPIFFLTGSSADAVITDLLRHAEQIDVWGTGTASPTVQLLRKADLPEMLTELRRVGKQIADTDEVEIATQGASINLSTDQKRVLRIFTRKRGGSVCEVFPLAGGLSSARVLRIKVRDDQGASRIVAAAKLDEIASVDGEVSKFDADVIRLPPGAFPAKVDVVRAGARTFGGVFYRLLDGFDASLFSVIANEPLAAKEIVNTLKERTAPWRTGAPTARRKVSTIRRRILDDKSASAIKKRFDLSWASALESKMILTRECCVHADLHGGNVLFDTGRAPVLIDFASVGLGPASLDPITLELCSKFHPDSPLLGDAWPSEDQAKTWANRAAFAGAAPASDFVAACRDWAHEVAAGDREVYATAYAYLLRQLKYDGPNTDLALTMLTAVRDAFDQTYS